MSTSTPRVLLALAALALASCGGRGPSVPPTGGSIPPGGGCERDDDCENGLSCQGGVCDFTRCNRAPSPQQWCATRLGVELERAVCEEGSGQCELLAAGIGGPCDDDGGCEFGLICEGERCVETCTSSASCVTAGHACLERAAGGAKFCQPSPGCDALDDPIAHCADVLGLPASLVACGEGGQCAPVTLPTGASCRFDAQCEEGVCHETLCASPCEGDVDCPGGEVCRARGGDLEGRVCAVATCRDQSDPDAYCVELLGDELAQCDFAGECEVVTPTIAYDAIMIEDVTSGEACASTVDGQGEPGADLMYALLLDWETAEIQGYGAVLFRERGDEPAGNGFDNTSHIAGGPPPFSFDLMSGCPLDDPPFNARTVYSMGCGGRVAVGFFSLDGAPMRLDEDHLLLVGEFSPECADTQQRVASGDAISLYGCTDRAGVFEREEFASCTGEVASEDEPPFTIGYVGF